MNVSLNNILLFFKKLENFNISVNNIFSVKAAKVSREV
jgi:hypothetical protein